ncbi:hypothetical protein [Natrinema salifodinae]|uniref:DUF7967 domain-containing protein n=1 Tax=Natrinema salifodinae TaxID=1202768 RepID=A0A1I0MF89_9EURY|nr:hypothetical protein [Natrinema salifodinae]SEV87045.1 hypothetical protein SAMN05216285_0898 [Natrinema salifodinae]
MTSNGSDSTVENGRIEIEESDTSDDADPNERDRVRVWLVERTYSDDELNLIILVYATEDGRRYHRRERALTSFTGPARETKAGLAVAPGELGTVDDPETRERYAEEASRMAAEHDPDDTV